MKGQYNILHTSACIEKALTVRMWVKAEDMVLPSSSSMFALHRTKPVSVKYNSPGQQEDYSLLSGDSLHLYGGGRDIDREGGEHHKRDLLAGGQTKPQPNGQTEVGLQLLGGGVSRGLGDGPGVVGQAGGQGAGLILLPVVETHLPAHKGLE